MKILNEPGVTPSGIKWGRYFQSDDYASYDGVCKEKGFVHLNCWDHARRGSIEAQKVEPKKKRDALPSKATMVLSMIIMLYRIELDPCLTPQFILSV